jgi:hypothetical protein
MPGAALYYPRSSSICQTTVVAMSSQYLTAITLHLDAELAHYLYRLADLTAQSPEEIVTSALAPFIAQRVQLTIEDESPAEQTAAPPTSEAQLQLECAL